jgi:hypothetical protein
MRREMSPMGGVPISNQFPTNIFWSPFDFLYLLIIHLRKKFSPAKRGWSFLAAWGFDEILAKIIRARAEVCTSFCDS